MKPSIAAGLLVFVGSVCGAMDFPLVDTGQTWSRAPGNHAAAVPAGGALFFQIAAE